MSSEISNSITSPEQSTDLELFIAKPFPHEKSSFPNEISSFSQKTSKTLKKKSQKSSKFSKKQQELAKKLSDFYCNYHKIIPPSFFLPCFFNHRLEGDLLLYDHASLNEDGQIRGLLSNFNACKHILSVSFDKQQIVVKLATNDNVIFTPFPMFVQRLKSQGDKSAYSLSEKINIMGQFVKETKRSLQGDFSFPLERGNPVYKAYQGKIKETLKTHEKELILGFRFKFGKNCNFEVSEISFNEIFVRKMGFSKGEEFAMNLLRTGFPDVLFIEENYHEWYSKFLSNSFLSVIDPKTPQESMNMMVQGFGEKSERHEIEVKMFNVEIDGFVEIMMMIILKPTKKDISVINEKKNEEFLEEIVENSKEKLRNSEFLKSFYPELLIKKQKIEPKVCSYKLL